MARFSNKPVGKKIAAGTKGGHKPPSKISVAPLPKAKPEIGLDDLERRAPPVGDKLKGTKVTTVITDDIETTLGKTTASKQDLANLSKQVTIAAELQRTIDGLEEMVKAHKQDLHNLTTRVIPDIMRGANTSLHKTNDGVKVELKDFINGSLPKDEDDRKKALAWLEKNGAKDLIKTSFNVALGRGQKSAADNVRKAFGKLGVTYQEKEDVHSQSLYAFSRERMKEGKELPLDLLGLYAGQVAKIELPDKETQQKA